MKKYSLFALCSLLAVFSFACADSTSGDDNSGDDNNPSKTETCKPGCRNNILTACDDDGTPVKTTCPLGCADDGKICKDSGSDPVDKKCTPGCSGDTLTVCNGNTPTTSKCPKGCNDAGTACKDGGDPVELCTPGCKDGTLTVCNGTTPTTSKCPKGCNDAGTACKEDTDPVATCTPGCKDGTLTSCEGNTPKTTPCPNGCNTTGTDCAIGGGEGCSYSTKCEGNVLWGCMQGFESSFNCADYSQTCSVIDGIANCRSTCKTAGDTQTKCNQYTTTGSATMDYVCTKAPDGKLYWFENIKSEKPCNTNEACNAAFTACEAAQTCNPDTHAASCANNIATSCLKSGTVHNADCTALGKTCVHSSTKTAECIENDLAACTTAGETTQRCGVSEATNTDVSITYTCKLDADGKLRYLDGVNKNCAHECIAATGRCKVFKADVEGKSCPKDAFSDYCTSDNFAIYCLETNSETTALDCEKDTCLEVYNSVYQDKPYADCFNDSLRCTQPGERKTLTDPDTHKDYVAECSKTKDGKLYYAEIEMVN